MKVAEKIINKPANTEYAIMQEIRERWSPRVFSDEKISHNELMSLFEAARWAPSSNNMQPWRFVYAFKGTDEFDKLFSYLGEFNRSWVDNAQILMLCAVKTTTPDGKENFHASHDLGLAMGNFAIQAQSMGIAVHQMAGFNHQKADKEIAQDEEYHFVTAVAIGKYGGDISKLPEDLQEAEQSERERKSFKEIISEGDWSDTF